MFGGSSKRDDGSLGINNSNGFAALESLRRKKKSDKDSKSKSKDSNTKGKVQEPQVFWAPSPLKVKSWADVDDEDDDDYFASAEPPKALWGTTDSPETKLPAVEESESEYDMLDEGDDDVEDEHEHEHEQEAEVAAPVEPVGKKTLPVAAAPKESERQLSKKELKKKELAELDAVLAEFGLNKGGLPDETQGGEEVKKMNELNGAAEKKDGAPALEGKNVKKKKTKKDKSAKEVKDAQEHPNGGDEEAVDAEPAEEEGSQVDVKERLKKMVSSKKKKSGKEMDAAARAAAIEAAARSAKLAAAKKKEKTHYNQQPVR